MIMDKETWVPIVVICLAFLFFKFALPQITSETVALRYEGYAYVCPAGIKISNDCDRIKIDFDDIVPCGKESCEEYAPSVLYFLSGKKLTEYCNSEGENRWICGNNTTKEEWEIVVVEKTQKKSGT